MIKNKLIIFFIPFLLFSCSKVEILEDIVFDYNQFPKIMINSESMQLLNLYESKIGDDYIDHSLVKSPQYYLNELLNKNINIFGTDNKLVISVFDASLKKSEILNTNVKKYEEKKIYFYEMSFLVEFILYDDFNSILSSTIVEAKRSTTSGKYISIKESERIIDTLIFDCLIDFSKKAEQLIKIHMKNFIL